MPSQTAPNGGDTLSNSTDPDTDTLSNSNYGRTIPGQTKFTSSQKHVNYLIAVDVLA